jgi:RNA polymerase sigma-70 factor (ECF subfamily)
MGIDKVEPSDAELVRRVRTGDIGAYGALVSRYRDRLGRYAVHMIGDREDAEEALQDSFVRAYRSLARCDDPARFGAWLYGILVNRCRTTGARAARRRRLFVHDAQALSGAAHAEQADRLDWTDAVDRALARLAPEYREAFLLKHVEDLEYDEISELTGGRSIGAQDASEARPRAAAEVSQRGGACLNQKMKPSNA